MQVPHLLAASEAASALRGLPRHPGRLGRQRPGMSRLATGGVILQAAFLLAVLVSGCGRRAEPEAASDAPPADAQSPDASGELSAAAPPASQLTRLPEDATSPPPSLREAEPRVASTPPGELAEENARSSQAAASQSAPGDAAAEAQTPAATAEASAPVVTNRLELAADLPPQRLIDFLRLVDLEMQNVATGRKQLFDVEAANAEMTRLSKLKLRAAEQLQEKVADDPARLAVAIRGQLQALSHLAALGDLAAAKQLETAARQHRSSDDPSLALDSRLVLLGLAMERLQNGTSADPAEILDLIDQIRSSSHPPDVSALMVMGQARAVLNQYGYEQAAGRVRTAIVELFAGHPNPNISEMAVQLVGSEQLAAVEALLSEISRGEPVTAERWRAAVEALLSESADLAAVQYLASAALQFEALGNEELVDLTFELLENWPAFSQAERDEIATAAEARRARAAVIGQPAAIDLPSADGRGLSLDEQRGRVVLMPFWAIAFPDSLAVLQTLDQLRNQFAGQVEIVGVNLDSPEVPVEEFLRQSPVKFRSFRSAASGDGANPTAQRFGVASLPFIAIIAPDGTVAAINLTGQGLGEQVQQLLPAPQ